MGFQSVLGALLPPGLGFTRLYVQEGDVIVSTSTGNFPLDALSGGLMALVEVAWQVFLQSREIGEFVVCLRQPENHLHPELQRQFLPRMLEAFPRVQFVVATHSPFIVGATSDANVYVLKFDETNRVTSDLLDLKERAGTANEILREVLGLETTLPTWAEARLAEAVSRYVGQELDAGALESLRKDLDAMGLSNFLPAAVGELSEAPARHDDSTD